MGYQDQLNFIQTIGAGDSALVFDADGGTDADKRIELERIALEVGIGGGRTVYGGTATGEKLTLHGSSHAAEGTVEIQPIGGPTTVGGALSVTGAVTANVVTVGTPAASYGVSVGRVDSILLSVERTGATAPGTFQVHRVSNVYGSGLNTSKLVSSDNLTLEANALLFHAGGSERVRIDSGGYIGLGIAPEYPLHLDVPDAISSGVLARLRGSREASNLAVQFYHDGVASVNNTMNLAFILETTTTNRTAFNISAGFSAIADASRTARVDFNTASGGSFDTAISLVGNNMGVRDSTPSYALDVTGDINATGEVRNSGTPLTSDATLKRGLTPVAGALAQLRQVRGYEFEWEDKARRIHPGLRDGVQHGVSAQEVQAVWPDLVSTWTVRTGEETVDALDEAGNPVQRVVPIKEEILCVDYARMVPILLEAVRELTDRLAALEDKRARGAPGG